MATRIYSVPDPTGAAAYSVLSEGRFLDGDLVEWSYDTDTSQMAITKLGDASALLGEPVVVATHGGGFGTDAELELNQLLCTSLAVYALVAIPVSDLGGDFTYAWWQVNADGTNTLTALDDPGPYDISPPDGNRETTPRSFTDTDAGRGLATVPDGTELAARDLVSLDAHASSWAALILGDTSVTPVQPEAPDPFDQTTTATAHHHHNGATDDDLYFTSWLDSSEERIGRWDGVTVSWETSGYSGTVPDVYIGTYGVTPNMVLIDPAGTVISVADQGDTVVNDITTAYFVNPLSGGGPRAGQLIMYFNATLFPDVGNDFFKKMTVTAVRTLTVTPSAATRYAQGQLTYLNAALDDTSVYDSDHLPGTDAPNSDYYDAVAGRWTVVVNTVQDGDNYGGDNQVTTAVYFEPFADISGTIGDPRRRFFS